MARTWLEACSSHNPDCGLPPLPGRTLPRRLLDLSSAGTQKIRILETTPAFSDEYVALSYCWGPVKDTPWLSQWLSYIIETQRQSKYALDMRRMPKTLQDAVQVCLALGYQWLWVDCLCILQGPNSDWQIESAKMSEIYEGSALTLSASEASDCRDGFLIPRSEAQLQGAVLNLQNADGNAVSLHLCIHSNEFRDLVRGGAVSSRAWCLQERILARRVLHYCTSQVFFECTQCRRHESELKPTLELASSSDYSSIPRYEYEFQGLGKPSAQKTSVLQWYSTVEDYTSRNLTMTSDKFVALSGLAKKSSESLQCEYLAGLWSKCIHVGLAWEVPTDAHAVRVPARAPSWSWAAVDGPVQWKSMDSGGSIASDDGLLESAITLVQATLEKTTPDPFGPVKSTELTITGRLRSVPAQFMLTNSILTYPQWLSGRTEKIGYVLEDEEGAIEGDLLCLMLAKKPFGTGPSLPPVNIVLVLEDAEQGISTYRRLGCGQIFPSDFFDETAMTTLRLV